MLSIVDKLKKDSIVVLELSSWQLEPMAWATMSPHIAVVTNLLDDHLDRYTSRVAYYRAKSWIWQWQTKNDFVILNADNAPSRRWKGKTHSTTLWFSRTSHGKAAGAFLNRGRMMIRLHSRSSPAAFVNDLRVPGEHIQMDALAAVLIARLYRVPVKKIRTALRVFRGVPHRLQQIRTVRGVAYFNDTTATVPDATIAALKSFSQQPILIAGGIAKVPNYRAMASAIKQRVKYLILLPGTATEKIKKLLGTFPYHEVGSMDAAVRTASASASDGDIILLSPGAASFGLFQHEFDRGEKFVAAVQRLR